MLINPHRGWRDKKTAKGIVRNEQKKLTHKNYRDIHNRIIKSISTEYSLIRAYRGRIYTISTQKNSLAKFDSKRYWLDGNKSVGFGSPHIKNVKKISKSCKEKNVTKNKESRNSRDNNKDLELNFNYKKLKGVQNLKLVL